MARFSGTQHDRRVMAAMVVYVVLLLALLPIARSAKDLATQLPCTLLPVAPMLYVIWQMARRIWHSDELEQRSHLIGLGVASGIAGTLSLISGFLATTKVLSGEAATAVLLWIFPIMLLSYAAARSWVARRYGMDATCESAERMPLYQRLLGVGAVLAGVALWVHYHASDEFAMGLLDGMAAAFGVGGLFLGLRRWWQRRHGRTAA